jgi:hypothetical protein
MEDPMERRRIPALPHPISVLVVLALVSSACDGNGNDQEASLRRLAERAAATEAGRPPADFKAVEVLATAGALEGDSLAVFGLLQGGARLQGGEVVLMDSRMNRVLLLDGEGAVRHVVGREGEGPGEFRELRSLQALDDSTVAIFDRGNQRFSTLVLRGDSLALVAERTLPGFIEDACILGDELFLYTARNGRLVEVLDMDGALIGGFGGLPTVEGFRSRRDHDSAVQTTAGGVILCAEEPGVLVLAQRFQPQVRAFSPAGDLLWETTVMDHKPLHVIPVGNGRSFATEDASGEHHMAIGLRLFQGRLVLQYGILDWRHQQPGAREIDTRLLDPITGREVGRTTELPMLGWPRGEHAILMVNHPFPRAALVARSEIERVLDAGTR